MKSRLMNSPQTSPLVQVNRLTKQFRQHLALNDCSLEIRGGEVFGLLGPNGAGKTTLLRLMMGYLRPTSGNASINGLDCYRDRVAIHRQVSYLPGEVRLFRSMNGRHVLKFIAGIRPDGDYNRSLKLAQRLDLDLSRWVAFMSTGMRQKLALAAVLSLPTPLTILDEPTANLDPTVRSQLLQIIDEVRNDGRTVIFSSHVLSEVEEVCNRVAILRDGKLVHEQCIGELRKMYRIRARIDGADLSELLPLAETAVHEAETGRLTIEVAGEIQPILRWLARNPAEEIEVAPAGLRSVYEKFHSIPVEQVV